MPIKKDKELQAKVYREYRRKGYGKERAAHIARAVVYGPRKPHKGVKRARRRVKRWWEIEHL